MSDGDGTYAPKSPNFSSFFPAGGPAAGVAATATQPPRQTPPVLAGSAFPLQAPATGGYGQPQPHQSYQLFPGHSSPPSARHPPPETYNNAYSASPYSSPARPPPYTHYHPQLQHPASQPAASYHSPTPPHPVHALVPPHPVSGSQPPHFYSPAPPAQYAADSHAGALQYQQPPSRPLPPSQASPTPTTATTAASARPAIAAEPAAAMPPRRAAQAAAAPEIEPSPVRTKFPTARIKRIMQADEEVGKVAQQTPIAVGKALELFMVQIVTKSADVAQEKGSKRISAQMLKQAIDANNEWDFLRDIVSKVSEKEETSKSGKGKAETESEDEAEPAEPKRKRGGRKKKPTS